MTESVVKIHVDGHIDDLYALSLLFPEGAYPDLHIVTAIKSKTVYLIASKKPMIGRRMLQELR